MAWPRIFATLPGGDVPASYLDDNFNAAVMGQSSAGFTMSRNTFFLTGDVPLNDTSAYFNGPSLNVGTSGVFLFIGAVVVKDSSTAASFFVRIYDGSTIWATAGQNTTGSGELATVAISALITNPAGAVIIQVKDLTSVNGSIIYNVANPKASYLTAIRVG